ncbi:hypothetical protein [Methanocella arvoryzae]|nr:hypothetical protein [Methanocella arvoryzae]
MPEDISGKVANLRVQFESIVRSIVDQEKDRYIFRILSNSSYLEIIDKNNLYIAVQPHPGACSVESILEPDKVLSGDLVSFKARSEYGFSDPIVITFPKILIDQSAEERKSDLEYIANLYINYEKIRMEKIESMIKINPIFGPASYNLNEKMVFVLMPFKDDLTKIYESVIKPTVEKKGLLCRRADELKTNSVIIQDIWKAICEARIVIADLTYLNANVFYELGIAHTIGKDTILVIQPQTMENLKFPFDLSHIRRIEYENSIPGAGVLEKNLSDVIDSILKPTVT